MEKIKQDEASDELSVTHEDPQVLLEYDAEGENAYPIVRGPKARAYLRRLAQEAFDAERRGESDE